MLTPQKQQQQPQQNFVDLKHSFYCFDLHVWCMHVVYAPSYGGHVCADVCADVCMWRPGGHVCYLPLTVPHLRFSYFLNSSRILCMKYDYIHPLLLPKLSPYSPS